MTRRGDKPDGDARPDAKKGLHPRSLHRGSYDFGSLVRACPELARFVVKNPSGEETVDYADPDAVLCLNRALLAAFYGIAWWRIPSGYLCPPVPGRADYIHHAADLLGQTSGGQTGGGKGVRALDIGTGAGCIYPLLGHRAYGWRFVAAESDARALASAEEIVRRDPRLSEAISFRRQNDSLHVFEGVVKKDDRFDLSLCNPPFHASIREAEEGTLRKLRNLSGRGVSKPVLNFGGKAHELCCAGGEAGFVRRMIRESADFRDQVRWFTTLVAKSANLEPLLRALDGVRPLERRVVDMAQGRKKSRLLAWRFR